MLETLARVDTLVLDKTGTLTEGKPKLLGVHAAGFRPGHGARALQPAWSAGASTPWLRRSCAAPKRKNWPCRSPQDFR